MQQPMPSSQDCLWRKWPLQYYLTVKNWPRARFNGTLPKNLERLAQPSTWWRCHNEAAQTTTWRKSTRAHALTWKWQQVNLTLREYPRRQGWAAWFMCMPRYIENAQISNLIKESTKNWKKWEIWLNPDRHIAPISQKRWRRVKEDCVKVSNCQCTSFATKNYCQVWKFKIQNSK